MKFASPSAGIQ